MLVPPVVLRAYLVCSKIYFLISNTAYFTGIIVANNTIWKIVTINSGDGEFTQSITVNQAFDFDDCLRH